MTQSQPDDLENNLQNVSLEEIKASAPRLDMDDVDSEDNCIICLQAVEDRTVLINCAHDRMCFKCIKKWTEQSRRCPLCNTSIGSHLIHRIRSEYDYQKFFLEPLRTSPPPTNIVVEARAVYRARTRRPSEIEQDNLERAVEKRRWVYRHGLFAKHIASNAHTRFRPNPTPAQIASSPELQSRCQMFVRRELRVWPNLDIEFLTSFVLSLAKSIDIRTESAIKLISEFLDINRRPSPSGGTVAEHFVHELYSYLRSPFRDLPAYDAVVQYDTPDNIETPPPTAPRSSRQNEVGPSRSRRDSDSRRYDSDIRAQNGSNARGRYEPDDPLDASPRDADSNSEMDMDDHWIKVPPSQRSGSRRDSPGVGRYWPRRDSGAMREPRDRELSRRDSENDRGHRGYETNRYRAGSREKSGRDRRDRSTSRNRSRSLGRGKEPSARKDSDPAARDRSPSSKRERDLPARSPVWRERVSTRRNDKDVSRDEEFKRHDGSRSPYPTRDRKGKRRADDYGRRDRREDDYEDWRQGSGEEGPGSKGKGKQGQGQGQDDGMRKRGAGGSSRTGRGNDGDERMPTKSDERRWKDSDAESPRDNDGRKGRDNTRRWKEGDERGSAFRDDQGKAYRRFSKDHRPSSRRYEEQQPRSHPDQRPMNGDYPERPLHGERPPHSSDDRFPPDDHPYEEPIPYKSTRKTSHEHVRQGSHESTRRPSKRTRSPSPKSKKEDADRDQKRPAVDTHSLDSRSASPSSANTRSHDVHGASLRVNGAQRPRSLSRGAQTRSRSQRRPDAHHNVQESKTSEVERPSTAHHTSTPFGLTSPEVDQTLSTQPGDNRDNTQLGTQSDLQRPENRNRAPRLTPLASIRAHLQGPSRCSEPLNEGTAIKGSPTRSTNHLESSATNYAPSAPGPTLLPNAVEKSSKALNDSNTNPIHPNDDSSVSRSILGAAARSQVQPPLITASPDSAQRVCPNFTVGRNRLVFARLEAIRAATNSDAHASHLSAKPPASPTLPDTTGNQSATNTEHDDHQVETSRNGQLGADPADVDTPAARFEVERRLKLQARLAARKREINAVMGAKSGDPL